MTSEKDEGSEERSDDLLAAEYVLGVLTSSERQIASSRMSSDPVFAQLVQDWEVQLAPLAAAYAEFEPPTSIKTQLDRQLVAMVDTSPAQPQSGLWSSLAFWRGLAAATVAAMALYIVTPYLNPPTQHLQERLVASLDADGSDIKYLVVYEAPRHDVDLTFVSGERANGKDFELWVLKGENAPVSIGVIPAGRTVHVKLSTAVQHKLAEGTVLAVSLEPAGGSPTGQPTGPVVATGRLRSI